MEAYKKPVVASKNREHSILPSLLSKMIFVKAPSADENLQNNSQALTPRKKSAE